ncbi:MAG: iron chaperone [Methanomassiliicoccales archaeon]
MDGKKVRMAKGPGSVDEYLAALPVTVQEIIGNLRSVIRSAAPESKEIFRYHIPIFEHHGHLVGYAAYQDHYSLHLMSPELMKRFEDELRSFSKTTATIHLSYDDPLPKDLVYRLVKARMAENEAREKK